MNILLLKGFNNYFNRIVKKYSTLADYKNNSTSYLEYTDINFNPNDGVTTELIIGSTTQQEEGPIGWEANGTPDYLICYQQDGQSVSIVYRWFVLESERTRGGQYRIALKRDVIADNFNKIIEAPCFIEKGVIKDSTNPLLYNKESMTYNQIKQNEILLKDETESAWIVGYLNNKESADNTYTTTVALNSSGAASGTYTHASGESIAGIVEAYVTSGDDLAHHPEYVTATINSSGNIVWAISWPSMASLSVTLVIAYQRTIDIEVDANETATYPDAIESNTLPWDFNPNDTSINKLNYAEVNTGFVLSVSSSTWRYYNCRPRINLFVPSSSGGSYMVDSLLNIEDPWYTANTSVDIRNNFNILSSSYTSSNALAYRYGVSTGLVVPNSMMVQIFGLNDLNISYKSSTSPTSYNGKIIHHNNKYYRITVGAQTSEYQLVKINRGTTLYNQFSALYQTIVTNANTQAGSSIWSYHDATGESYKSVEVNYYAYSLQIEELNPTITLNVHFPPSSVRKHLDDGVYDMFCIPYNAVKFYTGASLTSSPYYSMKIALALSKFFGVQLYDLQLLPYCPAREFISGTNTINERSGEENTDYFYVTKTGGDIVTFGLLCSSSSGTFNLNYELEIPEVDANEILNRKISNETDLYRLVSPNYSGQFEFSVAKNGGSVNGFNVDYTYRPYNPYIHVNPNFSGLYGTDWDDARGLICGGDFSLPIINDAWTNYQLNNKNYQNIFDRQIQSMDVLNEIAKEQTQFQAIVGSITGGIGGGVGGALAGAKSGGGYGAIAGAALGLVGGTALGITGGIKDEEWLWRQQQETRKYTIDMYNYQLGNIQAMPYSLTKSGSLTNNNKIFPMVEYYTCTEAEKDILKNVIKYDGMTIMAISKISNFIPDSGNEAMVKGRLIRLDEIDDDFHIADAIYQEIQKGVYVTPGMEE